MYMITYTIKDKTFYRYDDLKAVNHPCLVGTSRGIISFCKKTGKTFGVDYLYCKQRPDGSWVVTKEEDYAKCRDKVLISKEWANSFKVKAPNAPPLIKLEEHEMFRDCNGITYEVEVRGERHHKKCYFRASDVARCFVIPRLIDTITQKGSSYSVDVDYVRFTVASFINHGTRNNDQEVVYLTYYGLVRSMTTSRTGYAGHFLDWAMETLFAAHLGTKKQKQKLMTKLSGADYETVKSFCDVVSTKLSVVYIFRIGIVKDLRGLLDIPDEYPDNWCVYKYGRTNDIQRRFSEHLRNKYSKRYGFDTRLVAAWFVDNTRSAKAESDLASYFENKGFRLDSETHTEIAIFDTKPVEMMRKLDLLFSQYANEMKALQRLVCKLEDNIEKIETQKHNEISNLKMSKDHAIELYKKDIEHYKELLAQKDTIINLLSKK